MIKFDKNVENKSNCDRNYVNRKIKEKNKSFASNSLHKEGDIKLPFDVENYRILAKILGRACDFDRIHTPLDLIMNIT